MSRIEQLAIPLQQSQIEAASQFWAEGGWESKEFEELRRAFPSPTDGVTIKAIVVNVLYSTNIIAIGKVADCVGWVLAADHETGPDLVEALVAEISHITRRKNYSFASKYVHFFVDSNSPILDSYAEWMLGQHLGNLQSKNPNRYRKFVEDIETLKRVAGLMCGCAELDAYLWVAGEYWWWTKHPKDINSDLVRVFENRRTNPACEPELARLLGPLANIQPSFQINIHDES